MNLGIITNLYIYIYIFQKEHKITRNQLWCIKRIISFNEIINVLLNNSIMSNSLPAIIRNH